MNVPNSLTLTRILLAPLLAVAMLPQIDVALAASIFVIGMASDAADGYLARSKGLLTKFGALMDPIADKLFVGTAFVCLAATDQMAMWVVAVVFARDIFVTALRFTARRRGVIIAADQLGKAKTVIQAMVVLLLVLEGAGGALALALVYLMVAITVISGVNYAVGYWRGRRVAVPRVAAAPAAVDARPA